MQQLLQAEEIPRRFRRIRRQKRIGQLLERRIPDQRNENQSDHQNIERDRLAHQHVRIGHHLPRNFAHDLGRSFPGDERDALRILQRIRDHAGFVASLSWIHPVLAQSTRRPSERARNGRRQKQWPPTVVPRNAGRRIAAARFLPRYFRPEVET